MYEDKRTINAQGLLSQKTTPKYVPKPIKLQFSNASKPDADHVNPDKLLEEEKAYRREQLRLQREASSGGGGGKVICTYYHEIGLLNPLIYEADERYGNKLQHERPDFVSWYWSWAVPFVDYIKQNNLFSKIIRYCGTPFVRSWAKEMAYLDGSVKKGSLLGKIMVAISEVAYSLCK